MNKEELNEKLGEKWKISFIDYSGNLSGGFCTSYKLLTHAVRQLRALGSTNIVIEDLTSWYQYKQDGNDGDTDRLLPTNLIADED